MTVSIKYMCFILTQYLKTALCGCAYFTLKLQTRAVIHWRDHRVYLLHITAWAPTSPPLPHPASSQNLMHVNTHTQHKTTCLALKWEQRRDAVTVPRPQREEVGSADQPSVAQNGFWDSLSPSDGQPDFLGCVGTLQPSAPCSILIVGRILHREPTLFERQKLKRGEKKYLYCAPREGALFILRRTSQIRSTQKN